MIVGIFVGVDIEFVLVFVENGFLLDYVSLFVEVLDCMVIVYICLFLNL